MSMINVERIARDEIVLRQYGSYDHVFSYRNFLWLIQLKKTLQEKHSKLISHLMKF